MKKGHDTLKKAVECIGDSNSYMLVAREGEGEFRVCLHCEADVALNYVIALNLDIISLAAQTNKTSLFEAASKLIYELTDALNALTEDLASSHKESKH